MTILTFIQYNIGKKNNNKSTKSNSNEIERLKHVLPLLENFNVFLYITIRFSFYPRVCFISNNLVKICRKLWPKKYFAKKLISSILKNV